MTSSWIFKSRIYWLILIRDLKLSSLYLQMSSSQLVVCTAVLTTEASNSFFLLPIYSKLQIIYCSLDDVIPNDSCDQELIMWPFSRQMIGGRDAGSLSVPQTGLDPNIIRVYHVYLPEVYLEVSAFNFTSIEGDRCFITVSRCDILLSKTPAIVFMAFDVVLNIKQCWYLNLLISNHKLTTTYNTGWEEYCLHHW